MGLMRDLFGPSKNEIWRRVSQDVRGDFVDGGIFKGSKVKARHGQWEITLDTYTVSSGKHHQTYTRMRAPYVNKDGFRFKIYRHSVFSGMGKAFGMQDVEVGHKMFDQDFIIQGNDERKLRRLFDNERIRDLITRQPKISLEVKDDEGWFKGPFPEGVDELYFSAHGVIKDINRLRELFDLFSEVLEHLCAIGSAYENDPNFSAQ